MSVHRGGFNCMYCILFSNPQELNVLGLLTFLSYEIHGYILALDSSAII
jgi:hypothetical protein